MFADNAGAFYDGPQWIPVGAGNLVFSDFNTDVLQIVAPDGGTPQTLRAVGGAIGNAFKDGVILTASGSLSAVFRTFPDGGSAGANLPAAPAASPNDLAVGPAGNVYFTDPRYQAGVPTPTGLYRMDPANAVTLIKNFTAARVNGIAYYGPTLTLYVGTTTPKAIVKYTVAIDGSVNAGTEAPFLATGAIADDPDGLAVDVGGNVYIAEAAAGGGTSGRVEVFSPGGQKLGEIPFPAHRPTGVAFGGSDNQTLYITTEKAVFKYRNRCAGSP
jgi:gluconolactonase